MEIYFLGEILDLLRTALVFVKLQKAWLDLKIYGTSYFFLPNFVCGILFSRYFILKD